MNGRQNAVIPAQAGIQVLINAILICNWMPAFAGMTSVDDEGFL
jgi:hypothetical protein